MWVSLGYVCYKVGRTPLHYACMCRDESSAAALLEGAGAVRGARDAAGRMPAQYRGQARTLLTLPTVPPSDMARENTKNPPGMSQTLSIPLTAIITWFAHILSL